ncbi:peptidoglycan editing factor PgeF [Desulfothermobacter acidiphilus]|uniref:peptidoglycan editing factor PgeF n=1 Tax=Desulfothermobacter acidiphilus TaxID=1938353 RepID=UPI003F886D45
MGALAVSESLCSCGNIIVLKSNQLDFPWLLHAFSTRQGGVSQGSYASLNLGLSTGDDAERVQCNRDRLARALGFTWEQAARGEQVHGNRVAVVTAPGAVFPSTDALVTNRVGLPLLVFFADCVPIMLVDPVLRVIATVHAGWRGTLRRVVLEALGVMRSCFGVEARHCLVHLGPSIGPCCYAVGEEVAELFASWKGEVLLRDQGSWHLDLKEANRQLLLAAGVPKENITLSSYCTSCHSKLFYSHRRDGYQTGRMAGAIMLK